MVSIGVNPWVRHGEKRSFMSEEKNVNEQVVPAQDVESTPSVETTQEPTETVEAQLEPVTPPVQEEQKVPYNRFKEKVEEANYYKRLLEQSVAKPTQQAPQQPIDKYAGMDAETRLFYQNQEKMMREIANEKAQELEAKYQRESAYQKQIIGNLLGKEFTRAHPDVKEGSMEQEQIVQKIRVGYDSDDAYWSVMGPRGLSNAKVTAQKEVKQQFQAKKKANTETQGINPSGLPPAKKNFRDDLMKELEAEGSE